MGMLRVFYDLFCKNKWVDIDLCKARIGCTLAKTQKEVDAAIKSLKSISKNSRKVIGLSMVSTQFPPSLNLPVLEKASYLFLCNGRKCVIVDLSSFKVIPKSLYEFINLTSFNFVGYEMVDNIAPRLEKYGLVCSSELEAGPSFPAKLSMLLSLRPGDRNVSGVFGTKDDELSVVSIAEAYAAYNVGDRALVMCIPYTSFKPSFLCLSW